MNLKRYVPHAVVALAIVFVLFALWIGVFQTEKTVLIVGDSVTYLSGPSISRKLDPKYSLTIDGRPFYRSSDLVGPLNEDLVRLDAMDKNYDRVVFLVGYNDVLRDDVESVGLAELMYNSERFACSVWLELPATPGGRPAQNPDFDPADVARWNARMRDEGARHENVRVSDAWAQTVNAPGGEALVQVDGVHPTIKGQEALAHVISSQLKSC